MQQKHFWILVTDWTHQKKQITPFFFFREPFLTLAVLCTMPCSETTPSTTQPRLIWVWLQQPLGMLDMHRWHSQTGYPSPVRVISALPASSKFTNQKRPGFLVEHPCWKITSDSQARDVRCVPPVWNLSCHLIPLSYSPFLFFCIVLFLFLPCDFSANGPVSWLSSQKIQHCFINFSLFILYFMAVVEQLGDDSW